MFKRNKGLADQLVTLFVVAFFVFAALYFIDQEFDAFRYAESQQEYEQQSQGYRIFGLIFQRHDTIAQWVMAIFTIVAAYLLYRTLRTANETNEAAIRAANAATDANKIMLAEQRPWLEVKVWPRCDVSCFDKQSRIDFSYTITHKGGRPALNVLVDKSIGFGPDFLSLPWDRQDDFIQGAISGKYSRTSEIVLFPGDEVTRHTSVSTDGVVDFRRSLITVCVTYDAGGSRGYDCRIYIVTATDLEKIGPRRNLATDMPLLRRIG